MRLVANRKLGSAMTSPNFVFARVLRHAPQRIVVADAVGVVADVVARRLVAPRLGRRADLDADALAQLVQPFSVILGKLRSMVAVDISRLLLAASRSRSTLRLTLPAGVLGSSATNATRRGYSCWLSRWRTRSWISLREGLVARAGRRRRTPSRPGRAARSGTPMAAASRTSRMLQDRVLDLDRAHGPAGGDDDVVGAAGVEEVAVLVDAAEILGRDPAAAPPDLHLAGDAGRAGLAPCVMHLDAAAGDRLAQRAGLDGEVRRAGIAHQDHADLGRAVHAADRTAESLPRRRPPSRCRSARR